MRTAPDSEAPALFLLRVGIGVLWVHDGLVFKLLAPELGMHLPAPSLPLASQFVGAVSPLAEARLLGAVECALGLLLLLGTRVRLAAAAQCVLLLLAGTVGRSGADTSVVAASMRFVLLGASAALAATPTRGEPAEQEARVALVLRLGLGLMWLSQGAARTWLAGPSMEAGVIGQLGLVPPEQVPTLLRWLGGLELLLGVTLVLGIAVRRLAVLQVALLAGLTALLWWAPPETAVSGAGLSRRLAAIGCSLLLYHTGAGRCSLASALGGRPGWRQRQLCATLRTLWAWKIAMVEACRLQEPAASPSMAAILDQIAADDRRDAADVLALLRRHGGAAWPVAPIVRAAGWLLGFVTVVAGRRAAQQFDRWAKGKSVALYRRAAELLPPDEGITARALQAMQGREEAHHRLLHDAMRPSKAERRR